MNEIVKDFKSETEELVTQMVEILENCEDNFEFKQDLSQFALLIDRIAGGASSLLGVFGNDVLDMRDSNLFKMISDFSGICKIVGYKTSNIEKNVTLYNVAVGILIDGIEILEKMVHNISSEEIINFKTMVTDTFLERLEWLNNQFKAGELGRVSMESTISEENTNSTLNVDLDLGESNQDSIDDLIKSMQKK